MKASNATSAVPSAAKETPGGAPPSASSPTRAETSPGASGTSVPTPLGGYLLSGPSDLPDPRTHAYRQDLADASLAGRVIASHYADPLERVLAKDADLLVAPEDGAEVLARLKAGEKLSMLDNSRGWAWGYGGNERLVGYLKSNAVQH